MLTKAWIRRSRPLGEDVLSNVSDASKVRLREVLHGSNRKNLLNHMVSSVTHDDRPLLEMYLDGFERVCRLDTGFREN